MEENETRQPQTPKINKSCPKKCYKTKKVRECKSKIECQKHFWRSGLFCMTLMSYRKFLKVYVYVTQVRCILLILYI